VTAHADRVRQALAETETQAALLRDSIDSRRAQLDEDECYVTALEQQIAALRKQLAALPAPG
jgi:hypothetical protein